MMTMSDDWPAVWRPREDWAHPNYAEGGYIKPLSESDSDVVPAFLSEGGYLPGAGVLQIIANQLENESLADKPSARQGLDQGPLLLRRLPLPQRSLVSRQPGQAGRVGQQVHDVQAEGTQRLERTQALTDTDRAWLEQNGWDGK